MNVTQETLRPLINLEAAHFYFEAAQDVERQQKDRSYLGSNILHRIFQGQDNDLS